MPGRFSLVGYRVAGRAAQTLPESVGERLARAGGRAACALMRERRALVARHQRRAAGASPVAVRTDAIDRAVAGAFDSYARYWYELLRLPAALRRGQIPERLTMDGREHIERGLERGKGVIVALPHLGGWEWGAAWMAHEGYRMLAVVEPLEPPELYEWFVDQRRDLGLDIVALGPQALGRVTATLRDNRLVCLLSDRDLTGDGVEVAFFGERTTLPSGPALLALRAGATLLPVAAYFRPGRDHLAVVRPAVPVEREGTLREDVARITQQLAAEFELLIRAAPQQWHLMQPNWPSDRAR